MGAPPIAGHALGSLSALARLVPKCASKALRQGGSGAGDTHAVAWPNVNVHRASRTQGKRHARGARHVPRRAGLGGGAWHHRTRGVVERPVARARGAIAHR
eukprot:596078-Prymnesium_polylepis.2